MRLNPQVVTIPRIGGQDMEIYVITLTVFVCLDVDDLTCLTPVVPRHPPPTPGTQQPISNQRGQNNVLMGYKDCFAVLWAVRARKREPENNSGLLTIQPGR
ncbi:hypothetical protein J6590_088924 [Homalodisca vitripennis]|nr:hypothetical protein J6590_088924 [Homalodisca vitripennis]